MIHLTRLNHTTLVVNSDLIEHIETTPDTVIALTTGQKIMVLETANEVIQRVIAFRKSILSGVASEYCGAHLTQAYIPTSLARTEANQP